MRQVRVPLVVSPSLGVFAPLRETCAPVVCIQTRLPPRRQGRGGTDQIRMLRPVGSPGQPVSPSLSAFAPSRETRAPIACTQTDLPPSRQDRRGMDQIRMLRPVGSPGRPVSRSLSAFAPLRETCAPFVCIQTRLPPSRQERKVFNRARATSSTRSVSLSLSAFAPLRETCAPLTCTATHLPPRRQDRGGTDQTECCDRLVHPAGPSPDPLAPLLLCGRPVHLSHAPKPISRQGAKNAEVQIRQNAATGWFTRPARLPIP
jgi:hypothetical protein